MLCSEYGWPLQQVYYDVYPTDLPHLLVKIEKRHRLHLREQLAIAYNSQDKDLTQQLFDQLQDNDESYINRPYNKDAMEMFKNQVQRNRAFAN